MAVYCMTRAFDHMPLDVKQKCVALSQPPARALRYDYTLFNALSYFHYRRVIGSERKSPTLYTWQRVDLNGLLTDSDNRQRYLVNSYLWKDPFEYGFDVFSGTAVKGMGGTRVVIAQFDREIREPSLDTIDLCVANWWPKIIQESASRLEDVELFIKQHTDYGTNVRVWQSESKDDVLILLQTPRPVEATHAIAAVIPRLTPSLVAPEGLTTEERDLLAACIDTTSDAIAVSNRIQGILNSFRASKDLKRLSISHAVDEMTRMIFDLRVRNLEDQWNRLKENQARAISEYRALLRRIEETNRDILVARQTKQDAEDRKTELMDYLVSHEAITVDPDENYTDRGLLVTIRTTLSNFDPDMYERLRSNPDSYLHDRATAAYQNYYSRMDGITPDDLLLVADAVFMEQKLSLAMCSKIYLCCADHTYNAHRDDSYPKDDIPNVHLMQFDCFGDNGLQIEDALYRMDLITALEYCISATGNQNLGEYITAEKLFMHMWSPNQPRCYITPEGERLTLFEAIHYLKGGE